MKGHDQHVPGAGPRAPSPRVRLLVLAAVLWLGIDGLLLRIASAGNLQDWEYAFRTQPLVVAAALAVSVITLVVAGVMLRRPTHDVLVAAEVWSVLVAVFGVALIVAHHDSASFVVVGALLCSWLIYGAAGRSTDHA